MANIVVIGLQWGDEAKGKIVDLLSQDADYVVRYNGGNNAGHTVVVGDQVYKFHTVPVGILNQNAVAVITDGVVLDPAVFTGELKELAERGFTADKIKVSGAAHVLMPWHKKLDGIEENYKKGKKIGTTGRGIGPCYADKMSRIGIRIEEFVNPEVFRERLDEVLRLKNDIIVKVYGGEPLDFDEIYNEYSKYAEFIKKYVANTSDIIYTATEECKNIVFEGAHGSLLDIDHGTYPYVTSSHSVSGGSVIGTGIGPTGIDKVIGVAKAYTTRVGEGPCPTELFDEMGDRIRENGHEYGTTTGRPRRCGWFDAVATKYSCRINGCTSVALCLLDVLDMDEIKVCTHYEIDGVKTNVFPTDYRNLAKAKPVYTTVPGWKCDISGIKTYDDLPANCKKYVELLGKLLERKISVVSVGPKRDQTIIADQKAISF